MEYCPNGDLTQRIEQLVAVKKRMKESEIMRHFLDIAEAIRYIHARDVIHRDLKSPNIFIAAYGSAKLGDFGLCVLGQSVKAKKSGCYSSAVGTDTYFAPELHRGSRYQKGKASDVWALGCLLLEMMMTKPLWEINFGGGDLGIMCLTEQNFAQDFVQKQFGENQHFDKHLKSLLKKMLATDPRQRPTIEEILREVHQTAAALCQSQQTQGSVQSQEKQQQESESA